MPKINPELLSSMTEEYEHWWKYDSVKNIVNVMNLLGQACRAIHECESQINELEAEVQRLGQLAQY